MSFSLSKWLEQIDPAMKEYAVKLENFGFGSLKTLRNIDNDDISNYFPEMLPGHRKALLGEARKLITPVKSVRINATNDISADQSVHCKRQRQLEFVNNTSSSPNSNSNNISVVLNSNDRRSVKETENVSNSKKPRFDKEVNEDPFVPRTISDKEEKLVMRLSKLEADIAANADEMNCYMLPVQEPPSMGNMTSVCSNCHRKGHRADGNKGKRDCILSRCESYFSCGQKTKHPEYGRMLTEKKKQLANLKDSVKEIQEQLDMLRKFVNKTSETNFMMDVKRRLRICNPQKYRDVSLLLKDTRTLKVAYKGKIPTLDQDDSTEFPRVIKEYRHKVKCETGDFNLSDDDHDINFGNESVCESKNAPSLIQTKVNFSSNQNFRLPTWHGPFMSNATPSFMPPMQQQHQWFSQPIPYGYSGIQPATFSAMPMAAPIGMGMEMRPYEPTVSNANTISNFIPNLTTTDNSIGDENPDDLPLLSDLEEYLGI